MKHLDRLLVVVLAVLVAVFSACVSEGAETDRAALDALLPATLEAMGVPREVKLPAAHPTMVRARTAADAIVEIETDATWRAVAFVYAGLEGGWHASPPGFNDAGRACGPHQVHAEEAKSLLDPGMTCEAIRKDLKLGLRAGLMIMKAKAKECGSIRAGLTAYGTNGSCPKGGWTLPAVTKRLKIAGVK